MSTTVIDYHRLELTDYQTAAFFHDKRYGFTEATPKSGKTIGCMAWLLEQGFTRNPVNYWWIAPIYPQAKIAYRRIKRGLPIESRKTNESELTITLPNNHVLWFKGGEDPDSLYGEDVGAAVIDEASRVKQDAFIALRTTLTATRGPIRCIGNVKGRKNWFYRMCRRAQGGDPDMQWSIITADDAVRAGVLAKKEIEDVQRVMPEQIFKELYYCIPSDDGGNPFGLGRIKDCLALQSSRPAAVYGIDLAKSIDWTVVIGLDALGYVSFFDRWQSPWRETIERIKGIIGHTPTLIDSTGVGDPIVENIQRATNNPTEQSDRDFLPVEGFKFTQGSKQQLMEGLAAAIHQQKVHFPDGVIRNELESFEYHYKVVDGAMRGVTYEAMEGQYDDCVMALALAWQRFVRAGGKPKAALTGRGPMMVLMRPEWMRQVA